MRKIQNPWKDHESYNCFACAPNNPIGLHMEFFEEGDEIIAFWKPTPDFQGWIDTLHGGIQATLIDEIASWAVLRKLQAAGVTTQLNVRYRRPVLTTETHITLRARITDFQHRLATIQVTLENAAEKVCTEAEVVYHTMKEEQAREMGFTQCVLEGDALLPM